ncbi:MAG: 3-dehydroquinate synthase [Verrucomicrobiota bacterium]
MTVDVGNHAYVVQVGNKILDGLGRALLDKFSRARCAIVADEQVAALLGHRVKHILGSAEFQPILIPVAPGEKSKTLEQVGAICDHMIAFGLDRQSFVIGLGGGVIGDISGFAAAIYHRGIPHVQIPTTLLAMVDSSIGGKTGVNTSMGKNLIGALHHPVLVIDDMDVLQTLPAREFNQGFAEIIKHAIIADAEMFAELQVAKPSSFRPSDDASETVPLQKLIRRNIEIKLQIARDDEYDRKGKRALLNFGHTVGHAIERAGEYGQFLHGEAISLGMVAACTVSEKRAGLSPDHCNAMVQVLERFDLPTRLPAGFPRDKIFEALPFDKKFEGGKIRFVVTPAIGSAQLSMDVTMEDIREAVERL